MFKSIFGLFLLVFCLNCYSIPNKICLQTQMEANYIGSNKFPTYFTIDNQTLYAQQTYFLIFSGVKKVFNGYTNFLVYGHGYNKVGDIAPIVGAGYVDLKGIHISFTSPLIQYSTGN